MLECDNKGHYKKIEKILWVDFIRVVATFSIVWLHSSAPVVLRYQEIPLTYWCIGNFYNVIPRMGVPLFFMLSGYLLIGKMETLKVFFVKRINKALVPLLAWSIIYLFWKAYYEQSGSISLYSFYSIILTSAYPHLWFMYAIIIIYLYVPILRIIVINSGKKYLYHFSILWIIAVSLIPFAGQMTVADITDKLDINIVYKFTAGAIAVYVLSKIRRYRELIVYLMIIFLSLWIINVSLIKPVEKLTGITNKIDLINLSGYTGYLIVGYLLGIINIQRKLIAFSIVIFISCVGLTAYGNFFIAQKYGYFILKLNNYLNLNIILLSVSVFILLRAMSEKMSFLNNKKIIPLLELLSCASMGIYLIHPMFLYLLENGSLGYQVSALRGNPLYSVPLTASICFSLSFASVYFLQKVPLINKIVP